MITLYSWLTHVTSIVVSPLAAVTEVDERAAGAHRLQQPLHPTGLRGRSPGLGRTGAAQTARIHAGTVSRRRRVCFAGKLDWCLFCIHVCPERPVTLKNVSEQIKAYPTMPKQWKHGKVIPSFLHRTLFENKKTF